MSPNYQSKKLDKKQKRCVAIIQNECKIEPVTDGVSKYVAILNAGLSTGLTEELVLETVEKYGQISRLLMLPNKSYCFMECSSTDDAQNIVQNMNGISKIGQKEAVVYLSYFAELPQSEDSNWLKPLPDGLILLNDFITEEEERRLLDAIQMQDIEVDAALKHRKVKHFGYEFIYGRNNVDPDKPLSNKIPQECDGFWPRLEAISIERNYDFEWYVPDQLTVNAYEPGQGIPPHVDTHSAFLDPILSLSLESDVVMEFRKGLEKRSVVLPRRSLLIMSGEARYDWTHGITPRILDVVMTANGNLSTRRRSKRTSLTFRKLRRAPCNCNFPLLCDTKLEALKTTESTIETEKAALLEEKNVHNVYDHIAEHFSETRHSPWPQVADFLKSFPPSSILLDVGCGNGKYLNCNPNLLNIGCDRSNGLLKVCSSLNYQTFRCDCIHVPVRSNSVDGCISIAVIHHLATKERRLMAVKELARILRPSGQGLIYVWAKDQNANNKKSSYLRQNKSVNKQKATEEQQRQQTQQQLEEKAKEAPVALPVHTNRTEFLQQDVLVPWKVKGPVQQVEADKSTFLRYYHVFEENELESLIGEVPDINLVKSYYDQGNHCVIFEKI
ncbi:alkylated DNA repair protein alkB homolog 8-like [Musca vetustissima]|uniref:alkylated DNA repair protein alkB homolog 8-like n=1 Tax=Musca vetustissima TaxID=27455 RepID=UPI002AB5EFC5|nr:alkylated DNA repair protein alkB homolog 8-like [Musca vetustissima]